MLSHREGQKAVPGAKGLAVSGEKETTSFVYRRKRKSIAATKKITGVTEQQVLGEV